MNRNSLSRPTCFELPPPAELFFLWLSNAPIRLEASNKKQIQLARGPMRGKHTPPAHTAQGWLQLPSLQTVFSTPGTGSVWAGRKNSSVIANESLAWLSYGFGRMMSIGHACRRAAFPEHPCSFLWLSTFKHTLSGPVWEGGRLHTFCWVFCLLFSARFLWCIKEVLWVNPSQQFSPHTTARSFPTVGWGYLSI